MADNSFGIKTLNLVGLGTPKIESLGDLNLNAVNVAISTNATIGGTLNVGGAIIGDGSGLTGVTGTGSGVVIKDGGSLVGTASTIDFGTNLSVSTISAGIVTVTSTSSGLQSRQQNSGSTGSIGAGTTTNLTITTAKTYALHKIQTSHAAWVTVYTDTTSRTNDASRLETTDPTPGSGVVAEVIVGAATTQILSPSVVGFNNDTSPSTNTYLKVVNKSGTTQPITVTLHYLQLEN